MRRGHGSTKVPNVKIRPVTKKTTQTDDYDDEPSYEPMRESLRSDPSARPFAGMNICCSGVKDKLILFAKARELGATCSSDLTDLTTHLVADAPGSAKHKCAVELGIPVCTSEWIIEVHRRWLAGDDIDTEESITKHLLPPLKGVIVCVTRLDDENARQRLGKSSRRLGAEHRSHMSKDVTHLLVGSDPGDDVDNKKLEWVKRINAKRREEDAEEPQIAIVWDVWLLKCAASHSRVSEKEYAYSETGTRPEAPADIEQILRRGSSKKPTKIYVTASNVGAASTNNNSKEILEKARVRRVAPKDTVWGSILSSRSQVEDTTAAPEGLSSPKPQLLEDDSATEDEDEDDKTSRMPPKPVEPLRIPLNPRLQSGVGGSSMVSRLNSLRGSAFQLGPALSEHTAPASGRTTSVSNLGQKLGGARTGEPQSPPPSTAKVFSGKRIAPIGEACGQMLYDALRAHGATVIETSDPKGKRKAGDSEPNLPPEADFYIVRLASESAKQANKLDSYHKFRTDCWVEHCIFEDRLCSPEENITYAPLKVELPVPGAEFIKLHWTGLDNEQETAVKRLIKALGIASTETFARRVNTHLLCPSRSGLKYGKALQWQVAVVDMEWIYGIGKEGKISDADLASARQKLEQAGPKTNAASMDGPSGLEATDLLSMSNSTPLFGQSNGLLPTQRQSTRPASRPALGSSGSGSTENEVGNSSLVNKHQGKPAIPVFDVRPKQNSRTAQNSQIDRERKREAQRNQLANSLDALLKHQREESTHSDQPRKRARPNIRHKVCAFTWASPSSKAYFGGTQAIDGTPGIGSSRSHSLSEQVSSLSIATHAHDPDYVSPLEVMQPVNEETLQVHYQDPNQLAAKENLRRLLDGSSQVGGDILNLDTQTEPEETQDRVPALADAKRKRGGNWDHESYECRVITDPHEFKRRVQRARLIPTTNMSNGTTETVSAFFYGTLMHPAVLKRVIGNDASHLQAAPAVLLSFTRHHVRNCDYPAIVPYNVGAVLLKRELNRDEKCVRGVIISGLRPEDVACLDVFEGDEYNRVRVEAHPIVPLAAISSNLTQTLLSASSDLPIELPPALKVETYVWAVETSRLEPVIWEYDTFVKEKLWKWAGSGTDDNEYYEEVDRRRDMNGVIVVPSGGEGTLKPDYTFGHNMLQHFMFEEGYINLNHGSYGSLPKPVFDKCVETSKRIEARPDSFHRREYLPELRDVRARLAKLLNCDADECVVTNNATHGVHTIINNFHWKKGDILISFTSTYGSVFNICEFVSDTPPNPEHITVDLAFPISHKAIVDKFRQKLQDIPRHDGQIIVAVIDALASNPGVHLPWEELTKVCKEEGIYSLIDGAHAIGQIPLDMSISDPDFFVSASDTSYLSRILRGCAVLYVAKRNRNIIRSSFPTPHAYSSLKSKKEPDMISQFEWTGTIDFVPFLSAKHALEFREAVGGEKNINDYCHSLAVRGGARLAEMFKTRVMDTDENELTANMVNVQLPLETPVGVSPQELKKILFSITDRLLEDYNAFAATYIHDSHWWTRCIYLTQESDFDYVGRAYLEICKEVQSILDGLPKADSSATKGSKGMDVRAI
ncbi:PLP-dependent transferase [Rhizoctonia solani]|uniref:PLP-dependent transferase n=1 Tax=Rhizoctonia solani TaxID=456999 RepID=A0A8H7LGH3_9AGAM|nr:PLP-dependent transferase [Rhizoctonia solani]